MLFFQIIPKVAIAPLFLVWFGVGPTPKILVAFLISFFPIVIDAAVGLRSMSTEMTDLARSMGATRMQVFAQFRLPTSLPYLFSGLKVAATLAIAGTVVGEFVGADKGLGYLLLVTNSNMETALMFATIVALTIIGLVFYYLVELLEELLIPWHVTHRVAKRRARCRPDVRQVSRPSCVTIKTKLRLEGEDQSQGGDEINETQRGIFLPLMAAIAAFSALRRRPAPRRSTSFRFA